MSEKAILTPSEAEQEREEISTFIKELSAVPRDMMKYIMGYAAACSDMPLTKLIR